MVINMIQRNEYIKKIIPLIDTKFIKILSGVRRSGKSTILNMIEKYLIDDKGIKKDSIIHMQLDSFQYENIKDGHSFYNYLVDLIDRDDEKKYLLLDEVQEVYNWEKCVNSLMNEKNVDIIVTGSNSKLMSSEISTYLTGRYVSIMVFPLSFKEFIEFRNLPDNLINRQTTLNEYIRIGGFPGIVINIENEIDNYAVVKDIYNSVVLSDIMARYSIRNQELFDRIVKFIFENVGKTFSANSIKNFLKSEGRNIDIETIFNYISYLEKAFIIYKCQRYDLQGKNVLKTQEKYFLADQSFKYALFGFNPKSVAAMMENIIYLEMRRRGYNVFVGKLDSKEIDFVGIKQDKKVYIQSARSIPNDSDREINNLMQIKDNYPKYIITLDQFSVGIIDGIEITLLCDFLLNENW
ncbi:MAG: ATP-binding protein [Erysipelotrichales bacterium]|nr:ATP-binding protein [Erysipelotrichales bacterium]